MAIPGKDKQWRGQFPGNYSGSLWQTFNVDLKRYPGRIALADKMRRAASGLGVIEKFVRTNATTTDQWFGFAGDDIVRNGNSIVSSGTWVTDDTTGTFNDPRDMIVHEFANGEQRLVCTRATDIAILNSSGSANVWDDDWWTAVLGESALTSLTFHPLGRLQRLLAVGDKVSDVPVLHTIDKDDVVSNSRLTFPSGFTVRNIYASSNRFWIGLQNDIGGHAKIIEWDGFSQTYNNEYDLIGEKPLCGFIVRDIPYFITEAGYIFRFNGSGFELVQDFDLRADGASFEHSGGTGRLFGISNYGALVDGDFVYLNIAAPVINTFSATVMPDGARRMRSGIWVFDTRNLNLYHWMGIGEHASAGTDVNYGSFLATSGGIAKYIAGDILVASASPYSGGANWNSSQANGIFIQIPNNEQASNAGRNRGYFITPYIPIEEAEALWEALRLKFKRFVNSNNRIIVKWRTREPLFNASAQDQAGNALELMNAEGDWQSTTTFDCIVPTGVAVGDEVEILSGDNAGCSFNISSLSDTPDSSTTITVTIDEAAPTSSTDTFVCRFDNFRSETAITSTTIGNSRVPFTVSSTANSGNTHGEFIQLKIELRGFDVQIDKLIPILNIKTKADAP